VGNSLKKMDRGFNIETAMWLQILFGGKQMKISARNVFKGKVVKYVPGTVNAEVTIEIAPGIPVVAMITRQAAESLGLKDGKPAYAIIKASSVMVGVEP